MQGEDYLPVSATGYVIEEEEAVPRAADQTMVPTPTGSAINA